jgi:hypothetical protein
MITQASNSCLTTVGRVSGMNHDYQQRVASCLMRRGSLMVRYPLASSHKPFDFQFFPIRRLFLRGDLNRSPQDLNLKQKG